MHVQTVRLVLICNLRGVYLLYLLEMCCLKNRNKWRESSVKYPEETQQAAGEGRGGRSCGMKLHLGL